MAITAHDREVGRRLRDVLLSRVRDELADPANASFERTAVMRSHLSAAMASYVRLDNIDFVHVFQAPLGGWIADIHFIKVPPGVMTAIGTPVQTPCKTQQDALAYAQEMLHYIIDIERQKPPPINPMFMFYGYAIELDTELLDKLRSIGARYENRDAAVRKIEGMQATLFPNGVPKGELELAGHELTVFLTILHMAAMTMVLRYPPIEPAIINDAPGREDQ